MIFLRKYPVQKKNSLKDFLGGMEMSLNEHWQFCEKLTVINKTVEEKHP
jgi:hypothetical protein